MSNPTYLAPYINFNGQAAEAMKFYQSIFGGELVAQTFAESGMPTDDKYKDQIMHAQLTTGQFIIMASDTSDHGESTFGTAVNLSVVGDDNDVLTAWFNKLAEGGKVTMPLEKQFWGDTFGALTDKFNINWMININDPQAKPVENAA